MQRWHYADTGMLVLLNCYNLLWRCSIILPLMSVQDSPLFHWPLSHIHIGSSDMRAAELSHVRRYIPPLIYPACTSLWLFSKIPFRFSGGKQPAKFDMLRICLCITLIWHNDCWCVYCYWWQIADGYRCITFTCLYRNVMFDHIVTVILIRYKTSTQLQCYVLYLIVIRERQTKLLYLSIKTLWKYKRSFIFYRKLLLLHTSVRSKYLKLILL